MLHGPYCGPVARPKFAFPTVPFTEACPVEWIESIRAELEPQFAAVAAKPYVELFDQRNVVDQYGTLPEDAVVL